MQELDRCENSTEKLNPWRHQSHKNKKKKQQQEILANNVITKLDTLDGNKDERNESGLVEPGFVESGLVENDSNLLQVSTQLNLSHWQTEDHRLAF